jgi:hypothetical protein
MRLRLNVLYILSRKIFRLVENRHTRDILRDILWQLEFSIKYTSSGGSSLACLPANSQ